MKPRRRARSLSLEVLYESDIADRSVLTVLQRRLDDLVESETEEPLNASSVEFARDILVGVSTYLDMLDGLITRFAPEWPLDQVAVIDRNVLRMAMYEILIAAVTPVKVAINEAVELAKLYGSDSAPRFINGVLGTLSHHVDELRADMLNPIGE